MCLCVRLCACAAGYYSAVWVRRGAQVSKITKSVWQLTISGFWLRFVDMTSPPVAPKLTPGILGSLTVLQTGGAVSWQNEAARAPSPHRLPYLPAETPVIRVWATCRKNSYREHGVMDIANYAAILLMDAGAHTHTHTQRHIHTGGGMMHMWIQWDHYRTKSGLILTYSYYLPQCCVSTNTQHMMLLITAILSRNPLSGSSPTHLQHSHSQSFYLWVCCANTATSTKRKKGKETTR